MAMLPRLALPPLDTTCRTASIATSVESHVLRDRFWDAFAIDTGSAVDSPRVRNHDAHGPSAYRGLSAVDRLRHLGSALYPVNESVRDTSRPTTPEHPRELAECKQVIRDLNVDCRNGSEILTLPTTGRKIATGQPTDGLSVERHVVQAETDRPIPHPDSQPPELHWAAMFLNNWATSLDSYASTPKSPIVDERYIQEVDSTTLNDFFENVKCFQPDHSTGHALPRELYDRPKSPKAKRPTADVNIGPDEVEIMLPTILEKRTTSSSDPARKRWCGNWAPDSLMAFTFGSDCLRSMSM